MRGLARFIAALGAILLAVLAVVAVRLGERLPLSGNLRAEYLRDARRTWPRPAFGNERDGDFATLAAPGLRRLELEARPKPHSCWSMLTKLAYDTEGWRASGNVDSYCRDWIDARWPAASIVLDATHARLGSSNLVTVQDILENRDPTSGAPETAEVATLHMVDDLDRGRAEAAVRTCLDVLALGRDVEVMGTVMGAMVGNAVVWRGFPICAAALDASPDKASPAVAIRAIEAGLPPRSRMFHTEALAVAASLTEQLQRSWSPYSLLSVGCALDGLDRLERDGQAADEPEPARSADIARNEPWSLNPCSFGPERSAGRFLQREGEMRARLRLLRVLAEVAASQQQTGAWPLPEAPLTLEVDKADLLTATLRDPDPIRFYDVTDGGGVVARFRSPEVVLHGIPEHAGGG